MKRVLVITYYWPPTGRGWCNFSSKKAHRARRNMAELKISHQCQRNALSPKNTIACIYNELLSRKRKMIRYGQYSRSLRKMRKRRSAKLA